MRTRSKTLGTVKEYDLPITSGESDAYYQKSSNWAFWIHLPPVQHTPIGTTEYDHKFNFEIISVKDPTFA